ncbi:MAG TPA: DUF4198 domain-containing protein [Thermoanaerobaculia bacterium]
MRRRRAAVFILALPLAGPLLAHDFWIEPSSFRPAVGSTLAVRLVVGQKFRGEALPRNPAMIVKFVLVSDAGEKPVVGRAADEPAGSVRIEAPGLLLLGYRSLNNPLSLEPQKFEEYLREEGLEKIIEIRRQHGDSQKPSREVFSRCAKALLRAGEGIGTGYDRTLGFTLELVPERNPYALKANEDLPVKILYEGKPLAGALVAALSYAEPEKKLSQRSDRNGRVRFRLPGEGVWLIKAVHMVEAAKGTGADWQSLWASLTFEVPRASPVGKAP